MWCGVGKTNHIDEPYIKLVMFVFLQTDSSRTVCLLATASEDRCKPECIGCGWPANDMGGARTGKTFPGATLYTINYTWYVRWVLLREVAQAV